MGYRDPFDALPEPAAFPPEAVIRELSDGLVLRRATAADAEPLAAFQRVAQADPPAFEPLEPIGCWTRELADGRHPRARATDFTLVEDRGRRRIASSLCLLSHRFALDGVPLDAGQVELVATHPDYRHRGLVAAQFDAVHRWSAERGQLLQVIDGIPYFYRRFGYEMALEQKALRVAPLAGLPEGPLPDLRVRAASEEDIPFLADLYERSAERHALHCLRDVADWRFELGARAPGSYARRDLQLILGPGGERLAFFCTGPRLDQGRLPLWLAEAAPGVEWPRLAPALLHALRVAAERAAHVHGQRVRGVAGLLGTEHPLYTALEPRSGSSAPSPFGERQRPYAWYVRCPDLPGLLRRIAPVLEARLARSALAGHDGSLALGFYRDGVRLDFASGKLRSVEPWLPSTELRGDVAFPGLCFLQLLLGFRTLGELYEALPDCVVWNEAARQPVEVLFPRRPSSLWPTA